MSRIAVVLFNLGGPDGPKAVRPFLKNLFSDPAIIAAPSLVRMGLAELISRVRENSAIANYAVMGAPKPGAVVLMNVGETGKRTTPLLAIQTHFGNVQGCAARAESWV